MSLHTRTSPAGLRTLLSASCLLLLAFASAAAQRQPGAGAAAAAAPANNQTTTQGTAGNTGGQAAGANTAAGPQTSAGTTTTNGTTGSGNAPARETGRPHLSTVVRVTNVYNQKYEEAVRQKKEPRQNASGDGKQKASEQASAESISGASEAGLNDIVIVEVSNLEALLRRANCEAPYDQPPCQPSSVSIFINGRELKGLEPESGAHTF